MMRSMSYSLLLLSICSISVPTLANLEKRVLPLNENCDPRQGTCVKGDWLSESVSACHFSQPLWYPVLCIPMGNSLIHWVVEPDLYGNCRPESGKPIQCGDSGTNTRCVCSSPKLPFNQCRCQYWTDDTAGEYAPAFCTAYYIGAGESTVHHYACCNNCDDPSYTGCAGQTYQGGSDVSYCETCGRPTGGGVAKYYFNCEDCQTQTECQEHCNSKFGHTWPGLCWKWVDCFAGCCRRMATQYSRRREADTSFEFCGDGTCQLSNEDADTCPSDCCYLRNSACGTNTSECSPECCQTATCCRAAAASRSVGVTYVVLMMALAWAFLHVY